MAIDLPPPSSHYEIVVEKSKKASQKEEDKVFAIVDKICVIEMHMNTLRQKTDVLDDEDLWMLFLFLEEQRNYLCNLIGIHAKEYTGEQICQDLKEFREGQQMAENIERNQRRDRQDRRDRRDRKRNK